MNKSNRSLGKRSTNTASLSNAISSIKSKISPVIMTGRVSGNPKPLKGNQEMWVPRTVRIFNSQPTSTSSTILNVSSIAANAGVTGQIRVLGLKVWNYTNQMSTSNYLEVSTGSSITETGVSTTVTDVGSSDHLPGVTVTIPRTIASNLVNDVSSTLIAIKGTPTGNPSAVQTFVTDVHFEYKTSVAN